MRTRRSNKAQEGDSGEQRRMRFTKNLAALECTLLEITQWTCLKDLGSVMGEPIAATGLVLNVRISGLLLQA